MLVSSTPTAGTPDGRHAREQAGLEAALSASPVLGAHAGRLGAHHDEPFEVRQLPVEGAQQAAAHAAEQLAGRPAGRR